MFPDFPEKLLWILGALATAAVMATRAHAEAISTGPSMTPARYVDHCMTCPPVAFAQIRDLK